jgi:serine protease Do
MRDSILVCVLLSVSGLGAQTMVQPDLMNGFGLLEVDARSGGSYLGVRLGEIDADRASALKLGEPRGVEVTGVEEGTPAEKAGIKTGDVLLNYNGENILGAEQLGRLVRETPQGRKVKIQLWRNGKSETVFAGIEQRRFQRSEPSAGIFAIPDLPNVRDLYIPDIPSPVLTWRSSALGIEGEPVDSQLAEYFGVKQGVLVRSVAAGSPAEKAGLKAGDVLTKIGDRPVTTPRDLSSYLRSQHPQGKQVPILLMRDHKELSLNVTPEDSPNYSPFRRAIPVTQQQN